MGLALNDTLRNMAAGVMLFFLKLLKRQSLLKYQAILEM
nr:hypothetical protein [Pseudoalteromonas donghaensis]